MNEVRIGIFFDWDVPSDYQVDNSSGVYLTHPLVFWQRGVETDSEDEDPPHDCPISEDQRYAGVSILSEPVQSVWTLDNASLQYGNYGFLHPDSVYNRMSKPGFDIYSETGEDSVADLHTGLSVKTVDMSNQSSHSFVIALVTSNAGFEDFTAQMETAYQWAIDHGIVEPFCDCIPADVNGDGGAAAVGDAVYIVAYVFRGGPSPRPYDPCSGDANGDCQCNIGDAVYIINYVFFGGPPPPACEQWVQDCGGYEL
jgi:hypothetical protein